MQQQFTCPVCGKGDLHNYHEEENPKCPNCGSDLKIYKLLDELREDQVAKRNIWKPIAIIAIAAAVVFALLSASMGGQSVDNQRLAELDDSIRGLQEHVSDLQRQLNPSLKAPVTPGAEENKTGENATANAALVEKEKEEQTAAQPEKKPEPAPAPPKGKRYYVIEKGDNYWKISNKLYGDGKHVEEIQKLNANKKSSNLGVGDSILVMEP